MFLATLAKAKYVKKYASKQYKIKIQNEISRMLTMSIKLFGYIFY